MLEMDYTPESGDLEWLADAACRDMNVDDFFVEAGRTIDTSVLDVCRRCPVRRDCLDYAYDRDFTSGYFGGMSPGQRRTMSHKQAHAYIERDKPRKPRGRTGS